MAEVDAHPYKTESEKKFPKKDLTLATLPLQPFIVSLYRHKWVIVYCSVHV